MFGGAYPAEIRRIRLAVLCTEGLEILLQYHGQLFNGFRVVASCSILSVSRFK